ncbi:Transcription initiation factor TFIIB, Brf1 subunit/Transcription initiation factor TFIIB [Natranaeroarchaeum sulfidigenes]|uniref:Transcription initiation factor IIB n=2 Tax=Natranaeroarchaeum sulfidigenes TaxID=2784880 RepID=A0A897MRV1_9EURY|nr:Transcription initiation factor TFIIB, Brf1 subunit/Transcription initiation factor TFIIB [Natranaeroarchaeum sulfidigenes]
MSNMNTYSSTRRRSEETKEDSREGSTCGECESGTLVHNSDRHELVCNECGLVVEEESIDYGPEWRAFNHSERQSRSRVGAPTTELMHDRGLTTKIDWRDKDANGRTIQPEQRSRMQRLRKWQQRIRTGDAGERNLKQALSEISRMSSALGVPHSVREVASVIYQKALDADLIRGRSIEGVATASLYAACRQENIPRSLDELAEVSRVDRKEIGRTYRHISQELDLVMKPVDPTQYLPRFCSQLDVDGEIRQLAKEILETTVASGVHSGKSPTGCAAAAIYLAAQRCNREITQRDVADVAQVTVVTIRNRYQEQVEVVDEGLQSA